MNDNPTQLFAAPESPLPGRSRKKLLIGAFVFLAAAGVICFSLARFGMFPASNFPSFGKADTPRLFPACQMCKDNGAGVVQGGRWGFINKDAVLVIGFQFEEVGYFSEGFAAVRVGGKWGYIDERGKFVISPQFDDASFFNEGLAAVEVGDKFGYIDKKGDYQINPQFDSAQPFDKGLAAVATGSGNKQKWGYINKEGQYEINPQFDSADAFQEGLAAVQIGQKWGYIDKDGRYVISPQFEEGIVGGDFSDGLATIQLGDKWGYINKEGKYVINPQFDEADDFDSSHVAAVKLGDKWGYIGRDGKYVINPQFERVGEFSEGKAPVEVGGKWGYIDETGRMVISPQFSLAEYETPGPFVREIAGVFPNLFINTNGDWVWPSAKAFRADSAQLLPLLQADIPRGTGGEISGQWQQCVSGAAARPICYTAAHGDPTGYAIAIFRDRKAAQLATKLGFDAVIADSSDGAISFVLLATADGWKPIPNGNPALLGGIGNDGSSASGPEGNTMSFGDFFAASETGGADPSVLYRVEAYIQIGDSRHVMVHPPSWPSSSDTRFVVARPDFDDPREFQNFLASNVEGVRTITLSVPYGHTAGEPVLLHHVE
jgi:predicted DNA-binding WGR domain protein